MMTAYTPDPLKSFDTAIVLINYNGLNDTNECIESIAATTNEKPFIIVLDNASNDSAYLNDQLVAYPHLQVILQDKNVGFGRANNIAIQWLLNHITSNYIFILNNDTILTPGLIDTLKTTLADAPHNTALTAPRIMVYANPEEIWYGGGDIDFNKMSAVINKEPPAAESLPYTTSFASGCAMFFKTAILKQFGGFDPFYFMYDEDVELSINITQKGYEILYVPSAVLYHKCQGSQVKSADTGGIPDNQLHPSHPSLLFYLNNTIINRRYSLNKHLKQNHLKVYFSFYTYWFAKSAQYLLYGKWTAFATTLSCLIKSYDKYPNIQQHFFNRIWQKNPKKG